MPLTTVLIADDHAVVADGLAALLKDCFDVVGVVHDGRALLESAQNLRPDVILTDISMPGMNGLDAIRKIKEIRPLSKIIVLTMHADAELAAQAFRSGAVGYLLKSSQSDELISAIREVGQGHSYLSPLIASDFISALLDARSETPELSGILTSRQREVLQLLAEGKTMKETAAILRISPRTVESHKYEIMKILGFSTNSELVQYAIRLRLIGS